MGGSGSARHGGGGARDGGRSGAESPSPVARALAAALYSDTDDDGALDTGASLLAAADPEAAGRELLRRGEEYVRRAWERGWLPADLDREARRQGLDPAARTVLAELAAAELARYGNGLAPAWRRRLADLAAPAWAGTGGRDRFGRATAVLQALRLLLRLPAIEPLGPPPGSRPSDRPASPPRTAAAGPEERVLGRIRALLAKAEATGYPSEAEALTAKAQELMARHSVDEAHLSAGRAAERTRRARAGSRWTRPTRRPRRSCWTPSRGPTAARPCGTRSWPSPPWSATRRTSNQPNCSTPHCWCRRPPR